MPTWSGILEESDIWAMAYFVEALLEFQDDPEGRATFRQSLVEASADAQAELDRMFEELVGGEEGEGAAEDDWLSLADASQVRSDMAAAAGTSPSASIPSGESRPASGVSSAPVALRGNSAPRPSSTQLISPGLTWQGG